MGRWPEWRRERVWELWVEGYSLHAIAREVGMARDNVTACVAASGGVRPAPRKRAERCLSLGEREEVSRGLACGESFRAIGRAIGRPHTTVAREVNRNGGRRRYRAQRAERATWKRARRPKLSKLALDSRLRGVVEEKLERKWSPQQISRWLRGAYEDDPAMRVRRDDLSVAVRPVAWGARRELCKQLRSGRHLRRPPQQRSKHQGQGQIPNKVMIPSARPRLPTVRSRVTGKAICCSASSDRDRDAVERQTRYCQLVALPDGHGAEASATR